MNMTMISVILSSSTACHLFAVILREDPFNILFNLGITIVYLGLVAAFLFRIWK